MLRDVDLIDDIITLRRQLAEAERQRENALDKCMALRAVLQAVYWSTDDRETHDMVGRTLDETAGEV